MTAREKYEFWMSSDVFDKEIKEELAAIAGDEKEIEERFYKDLEFGTGGLRGIIGAGTNRLNRHTVCKATQGLADFVCQEQGQEKGVVIAYDSRRFSQEFAMESALCLAANGVKAYVFESLRPTPELSFAVRELGCIAGVVITASHNPPEYNGYKVYWEDGAQITPPKDTQIIDCVNRVTDYAAIKTMDKEEALSKGLLTVIGKEIDDRYMEELKKLVENPDIVRQYGKELKIVYTPLHGTGNVPVRRVLDELGFEQVFVVSEQELPDGNFPTVSYPNPEDAKAFAMALELAKEKDADLVLATDPDADRLGVYAKDSKTGEYMAFTGNMSGMLICEYLLSQRLAKGTLPANGAVVKTIVTTNMADAVAKAYNMKLIETLTGFKYIGEQIKFFQQEQTYSYMFGFEESYGCLVGTHARDKDAVVAVMALCEAAAYYRSQGLTLWDQMLNIFEKYGYYKEDLMSITLKGMDGSARIQEMMKQLRQQPVTKVSGHTEDNAVTTEWNVVAMRDYKTGVTTKMEDGSCSSTNLPASNVLYYELDQDAWFCVRPSGTEPKIKFYAGVKGSNMEDANNQLACLKNAIEQLI